MVQNQFKTSKCNGAPSAKTHHQWRNLRAQKLWMHTTERSPLLLPNNTTSTRRPPPTHPPTHHTHTKEHIHVFPNFPSNKNGKQALSLLLVDLLQRATPPTRETSSVCLRNILKTVSGKKLKPDLTCKHTIE